MSSKPPSVSDLMAMRIRGQRPMGPVVITDNRWAARDFREHGLYAFEWPERMDVSAIRGLMVVLYQSRYEGYAERADELVKGEPKQLDVIVKGRAKDGSADLRSLWHG